MAHRMRHGPMELTDVQALLNQAWPARSEPYDEVYPGIFLGDAYLTQQKEELRIMYITHILNAAQGTGALQVDTTAETYADMNIQFYGVKAMDIDDCDLSQYFRPAAEFIHTAVDHENAILATQGDRESAPMVLTLSSLNILVPSLEGRIFVHCFAGVSRSASLVLAYLMLHHKIPLPKAVTLVRKKRAIYPNDGFLEQLCRLHNELFVEEAQSPSENTLKDSPPT